MTDYNAHVRFFLTDFSKFDEQAISLEAADFVTIRDKDYVRWLRDINGGYAYQGALRFFPIRTTKDFFDIATWNSKEAWKAYYGRLAPNEIIFCEDAFGLQFMFDQTGNIAIFWPETGVVESLGFDFTTFLKLIADSPDDTISFELYELATKKLRPLKLNEHFAFKVELSVGGTADVDNLIIVDSITHMRTLGNIAQQIAEIPVGTKLKPHLEE